MAVSLADDPPVKIHEYQAKSVLARFGVPVPRGEVAFTPAEAVNAAKRLGGRIAVVKAQIHAGGRGKGGGVKIAKSIDEVEEFAKQMIGMTLVTHQTGPEGKKVGRVLIEEGLDIDRELYLSILIDRATASRSEEHTSELQSQSNLVCRLLLEKKKKANVE